VLCITVPPLREHAEDIPLLVACFLAQLGFNKRFDEDAMAALMGYPWQGNVRELKNVVERACIMSPRDIVAAEDIGFLRLGAANAPAAIAEKAAMAAVEEEPTATLEEVERRHIIRVLQHVGGQKGRAAEVLGINAKTLYNKIKAYGITSKYE
jgi:DNA-binding NtrC family response regulator